MPSKSPPMREQVTQPLDRQGFCEYVADTYLDIYGKPFRRDIADRLFDIVCHTGFARQCCKGGYFGVSLVRSPRGVPAVTIEDNSGPSRKILPDKVPGGLPSTPPVQYNSSGTKNIRSNREKIAMPARGRKSAAPVETEVTDEVVEVEASEDEDVEKDYTVYADKAPTPAMQDFHDWLVEVGASPEFATQKEQAAFLHGVRLGGTLRMEFQRSDFNREQRAARRAARQAAAASEPEPQAETEEVMAVPAPRAAKAATPKAAAAKAPRGRGRPVAAGNAAPF